MDNNLHNVVRMVRAMQVKCGAKELSQKGEALLSLGTVLNPPPSLQIKLDDIPFTYEKGEILINETLIEHKRERVELLDKDPAEHSIKEGELIIKLPVLQSGDRILAAQLKRQKVVVLAKVAAL